MRGFQVLARPSRTLSGGRASSRSARSAPEGLHAPTSNGAAHCPLDSRQCKIDCRTERSLTFLDHHAGQSFQDHLDSTHAINAAARAVDVLGTHAHTLDRARKLVESSSDLASDVGAVFRSEVAFQST